MADGDRGITLVLINAKMDTVIERLTSLCEDLEEHERRIRALEQDNARFTERLGLMAGALAVLQFIGSAIAAAIGASR